MLPKRDAVRSSHRYKSAPDIVLFKAILYVKSQFRKLVGSCDLSSTYSEGNRDNDDTSSDVGSSSVGSLSTDKLLELLSQGDIWLGRAELLQSLLGSGVTVSRDDIADKESSARLCDC
ncbi:hypothetical protein MKX03_007233 [Papaver bracteatum]|nr:hypothetical protein MKX03_007233 [Papaver bracteatum]